MNTGKAIRQFEEFKKNGYGHSFLPSTGSIEAAIFALRAQQEREKGCEYCEIAEHNEGVLPVEKDTMCGLKLNYCPMCGRKLETNEATTFEQREGE